MSYPASTKQVALAVTGDTTLYVDGSTGSDDTGKGTSAQPFATIQAALDHVKGLDGRGYNLQINVAAGTYAGFRAGSWLDTWGRVYLLGDEETPTNVKILSTGSTFSYTCSFLFINTYFYMNGFHISHATAYAGYCVSAQACSGLYFGNLDGYGGKLVFDNAQVCFQAWAGTQINIHCSIELLGGSIRSFINTSGYGSSVAAYMTGLIFTGNVTTNNQWLKTGTNCEVYFYAESISGAGTFTGTLYLISGEGVFATSSANRSAMIAKGATEPTVSALTGLTSFSGIPIMPVYTKAQIGSLTMIRKGSFCYCTDETGGEVMVVYDGTNWRRVTDRTIMA